MKTRTDRPFEIEGKTYNPADLTTVASAWTPLMWTTRTIYEDPHGEYLMASRSALTCRPNEAEVERIDRHAAIAYAIKMKAPDSALETLGVKLQSPGMVRAEFDITHPHTTVVGMSERLGRYADIMVRNCDGRYMRARIFHWLFFMVWHEHVDVVSQRDAILYSLEESRHGVDLATLGVETARRPRTPPARHSKGNRPKPNEHPRHRQAHRDRRRDLRDLRPRDRSQRMDSPHVDHPFAP